jgi:hypothetical protein
MPYALKPKCSRPGCPNPQLAGSSMCAGHTAEAERLRGTPEQRGYDATHRRTRQQWAPIVAAGRVVCWRCGDLIGAAEAWDLGHDDTDRAVTRGPEHANRCNRAAGGRKGNARR